MSPPSSLPSALLVVEAAKGHFLYGPDERRDIAARARLLHPAALTADEAWARPDLLAECEVLFTGWGAPRFDARWLAALPRLRAVFSASGTVRGFVTDEFWERDVVMTAAAAANAVPVAEFTLAALIFGLKRVLPLARDQRDGGAWPGDHAAIPGCHGTVVGLVSYGLIARRVRALLRALDVRVLVHDPYLPRAEAEAEQVEPVDLPDLFARSQAVSLHTPWLPETENLVRARHLAALPAGATFINTARGAIVHEGELAAFLAARPDVQAVLDITHPEPPAADSPLRTLPNVLLTPHIAGSTGAECRRMGALAIAEFDRWRRGERLHHAVTRAQLARRA